MAPKPVASNAQVQRLTTTLKQLCLDYPAGGGLLRELLQNADDAGAKEVRFFLDEGQYAVTGLIHEEALGQYQGPALLAFNSGVFKDGDFESLANLGDSAKFSDGSKTGKFGRGFNTVYNWTDSPSIVSRDQFTILDPHLKWSTGGPRYNFVEDCDDQAMQNHMSAFNHFIKNPRKQFEGTVIRVPLRTKEQARRSRISTKTPTVHEVQEVMQNFAEGFGKSGLLFMKNVEYITIESTSGKTTRIRVANWEDARSHKGKVSDAIIAALQDPKSSFDHSFKLCLELDIDGRSTQTTFLVYHSLRSEQMPQEMRVWAKREVYFPWVAVAAQISPYEADPTGSLSTVLPLPIPSSQPVHIHAAFHLSPDRQRLTRVDKESLSSKDDATKWNDWLLHHCIPSTWAKLTAFAVDQEECPSGFQFWPRQPYAAHDNFYGVTEDFLRIIDTEGLSVWPTEAGYMTASQSLLNVNSISLVLRAAFNQAKVPVVYPPPHLLAHFKPYFDGRYLNAETLCTFLKQNREGVAKLDDQSKIEILQYLFREDVSLGSFYDLELFPFKSGHFGVLEQNSTFIDRDEAEAELFCHETDLILDLEKFSELTASSLRDRCSKMVLAPYIKNRSWEALSSYSLVHQFADLPTDRDIVMLDPEATSFVTKAWTWIIKYEVDVIKSASELWLIPLTNGHHRKIVPHDAHSTIYSVPPNATGKFMKSLQDQNSLDNSLMDVSDMNLGNAALSILLAAASRSPVMHIMDCEHAVAFAHWLRRNASNVLKSSPATKHLIIELIASSLHSSIAQIDRQSIAESVKGLEIFSKLIWSNIGDKWVLSVTWTNLDAVTISVGISEDEAIAVPEMLDMQFVHLPPNGVLSRVVQELQLLRCLGRSKIVDEFIVPNWNLPQTQNMPYDCRKQLVELIFSQYSGLSTKSQSALHSLPIVPVERMEEATASKFALPTDLIDQTASDLRALFFDDEEIFPDQGVFTNHAAVLRGIGLKHSFDYDVFIARINHYSSCTKSLYEIQSRIWRMFRLNCPLREADCATQGVNFKTLKWIPTTNAETLTPILTAPIDCRPLNDKLLVNSQMPVWNRFVSDEWLTELGWRENLPKHVLLGQLQHGIKQGNRDVIDAVLEYIAGLGDLDHWQELAELPFIFTGNSYLITPVQAFAPSKTRAFNCDGLQPYFGNADQKFYEHHRVLLDHFGVEAGPDVNHLLTLTDRLASKTHLDDADIAVAVEVSRLATSFPRQTLSGLKILSNTLKFVALEDISFPDAGTYTSASTENLTHPDILHTTVKKLSITKLSERLRDEQLEISDEYDEDYEQHEDMATSIVRTLESYTIESTFNEYLANADDTSKATQLNWLLDGRTHACDNLYDPKLNAAQGPALLVHNDDKFSDDDFSGFQNLGLGSKAANQEVIGQFGRGSQTMYHWTDTPMILSGEYLVILDAQRKVLGKGKYGQKRAGLRVKIKELKKLHPNHLAVFESLWGYTLDLDEYQGTIFRFPLRMAVADSKFRLSNPNLSLDKVRKLLASYFETAKVSLLFLRNITSIDFMIYGNDTCEWSVCRQDSKALGWEQTVTILYDQARNEVRGCSGEDIYMVAVEDVEAETKHMPYTSIRAMKRVECGFAAKVSSTIDGNDVQQSTDLPYVFKTLPLPIRSDFNLAVHATFDISGDRRTFVVNDPMNDTVGAVWNRYLLTEQLPKVLLKFLSVLAKDIGQDVFKFWPKAETPAASHLSLLIQAFWKQLPASTLALFPAAQPVTSSLRRRHMLEVYSLEQAVFECLPSKESDILAPLLLPLKVRLVKDMPRHVSRQLQKLKEAKFFDGPMLRDLSKTAEFKQRLQSMLIDNRSALDIVLKIAIPRESDQQMALDDCHIIPLLDGTLGTLRFTADSPRAVDYYVATQEVEDLFKFASSLLVSKSDSDKFDRLIKTNGFNLKPLEVNDIQELMRLRLAPNTVSDEEDTWLRNFWKFWNMSQQGASVDVSIDGLGKVLKSRNGNLEQYRQPSELDTLPAIIEPEESNHKAWTCKIPDLVCFDRTILPKSLKNDAISLLASRGSMIRLFKAFRKLSFLAGQSVGGFLKRFLSKEDFILLRPLIASFCTMRESHSSETRVAAEFDHDIKSISLWPTANAKLDTLLSSNNAFIAEHGELVVPWIKFYDRFVSPSRLELWDESMKFLQVLQIDTATLIQRILPLPPSISTSDWGRYKPIIATIAKYSESETNWEKVRVLLQNSNIAVDGNKAITHVRSLYDGHDQIFIAAFRGEEATKFLHPTVDKFKKFWLRAGLRHRKNEYLAPKDFLECLTSIATRLLGLWDVALELDISVVLGPLTSPSSSTDAFNSRTWKDISTKKVFGSNSTFVSQPPFRRSCMASVATETRVLSLSEVVSSQYVAVCWSQIPFPVHKPSKEVFHKIGTAGKPPAKMVWKHLVHLHSICPSLNVTNVRDFLSDLDATYAYLQDNVEETVSKFDYRTLPLFLNSISLDERGTTLVEVQSSWVDIEHLVLSSSCDAGLVQAVRPGLKRYEKLLKRLGCRAIVYPTGTRMNPPSTLGISNGHCGMKGLQNMREKQEGFDVTFHTEGREIKAHRLVLANVSDKWRRQFFGHFFTESVFTFYSGNKEDFLTYDALLTIIKYAYQEPIDESKLRIGEDDADDVKAKKLNVLLDLYKAAHFQLIETLANYVQYMIMVAIDMVINIDNVEEIQDKANSAGAAKVEEYCVSFYQENSETLGYKK